MNESVAEPSVSVCACRSTTTKYIYECLQTITDQNYKNIDLIVIDDGSDDYSSKVVKKLISNCESIFVRFEFIT